MDKWDPMANDYYDKSFNRYSEGVGRDLLDASGNSSGAKLFVGNLPKGLGHEGLYNLFAEYGAVEEAHLRETDKDQDYGFVTMRSAVDSERAIRKLHQKKIGKATLKVDVAITKEERDRRRLNKEKEKEIMGSLKKSFDREETGSVMSDFSDRSRRDGRGRHNALPLGGKGRGYPSGTERGAFGYPTPCMGSGRGSFHRMMPYGNLGPMPFFPGMGRADGRFGGGGLPPPGMAGPGIFPMREQMMQRQFEGPKRGPGGHFIDLQVPENPRLKDMKCCTLCRKDGCTNLCSVCRLYYCSVECQKRDWPNHKDICAAFREYYKMKGPSDASNQQKEGGKLSGESDSDFRKKDAEKNFQKKSRPGGRYDSDHSNSQDDSDGRKLRAGLPQKRNGTSQNSVTGSQGDAWAKKAGKPVNKCESPSKVDQGRTNSKHQQNGETGDRHKEDVQAIPGGAGDAMHAHAHIEMTIPVGSSGKAYLTHYESPYKFWISLVDQLEDFTDTTNLISKQETCAPPSAPKPKDTYGAMWEGEWARLEIVSVSGEEATVFFVDYGNTGVVKIKDLRPLTLDILKLPAQALCCCVSKIKPKGNVWSEVAISKVSEWFGPPMSKYFTFEVVAKRGSRNAVKVSIDNEALSEMLLSNDLGERDSGEPGLPSITAAPKQGNKPSRFTVKELRSELDQVDVGDQLTTLLLATQCVEKIIAVKQSAAEVLPEVETLMAEERFAEQPPYRASAGDIVAAVFSEDQKWYRAHVLKADGDMYSLFFVDYGNTEDQKMENIREIRNAKLKASPAQALPCSLHGLDSIATTVTQDDIATEFAQLLPSYQVDGTWTLLSVKAKKKNRLFVDVVSTQGLSLVESLRNKFPQAENSKAVVSPSSKAMEGSSSKNSLGNSLSFTTPMNAERKPPVNVEGERLPINPETTVSVMVTYIQDCSQFYVRLSSNEQKLQAMTAKLIKAVKASPKFQTPPTIGSVALVQFSLDKRWYRGRVLSLEPATGGRCKVMFIDYGNCEMVRWADLKELEPALCQLPAQAVRCCLDGELEQLEKKSHLEFKQYLENETVDLKVVGGDVDSVAVHMYARGTHINSFVLGTHSQTAQISAARKIDNVVLKPGSPTKVECVNLISPAAFYVQVSSQVSATIQLTQDLTTRLAQAPEPVSSVAVGDFVASKFSEDSDVIWYRGRVDKVQGERALIYFVDFGNFEDRDKAGLMCLSDTDFSVPAATLKCQLPNCKESSPEVDAKFSKEGQSQIDSICVISQNEKGCVVDILSSEGNCITNMFLQAQGTNAVKCSGQSKSAVSQPSSSMKSSSRPSPAAPECLPTEPLGEVNSFTDVGVTEIKSFTSIYVTSTDSTLQTKLLEVMVALNETADSLPQLSDARPGSLCAARFSLDSNWYRARIVSKVSPTTCEVQFVDYGNSEETQTSQLKALTGDARFMELPAQAVKCCLVGFESGIAASSRELTESEKADVARLKTELLEKPVRVKVMGKVGDTNVVDIENEQQQLMSTMFKCSGQSKSAVSQPSSSMKSPSRPSPAAPESLPTEPLGEVNSFTDVGVTEIKSFTSIYVTSTDSTLQTKLLEVMVALNETADSLPQLSDARPGSLCAARFSLDSNWYRARIVSKVSPTTCEVQFVDYGNSEETQTSQLKALTGDARFMELPAQAVKCCLVGFESSIAASSRELTESEKVDVARLKAELLEKPVRVKVMGKVGDTNVVDIENEQQQLMSTMFKCSGQSKSAVSQPSSSMKSPSRPSPAAPESLPTEPLGEVNSFTDVGVTEIKSFTSIYVTSTDSTLQTKLLEVMVALNETADSLPQLSDARPGSLCAARFSLDSNWYRARIVSKVSPTTCEVQFVDYGNSEETQTSQLKALTGDARFMELPAQAVKCCLVGFESGIAASSRELTESEKADVARLKTELLEKPVRVKVMGKVGDTNVVDIENEQQQLMSTMFKCSDQSKSAVSQPSSSMKSPSRPSPAAPESLPTEPLGEVNSFTDVGVTEIKSFTSIYVTSTDSTLQTKLLELMVALNETADSLPQLSDARPGSLCAARFSLDSNWYRARIVSKVSPTTCEVQFVDYGNSEETQTSQLKALTGDARFMELPAQAVKCCLVGFESGIAASSRELTESEKVDVARLKAELLEKPVRVKVMGKVGDTNVVDIENEQQQLMSTMFKKSLATNTNVPMLSDLVHETQSEKQFDAIILQLTSLDDFYCHRCNEEEMSELTRLGELLESDINQLPPDVTVTPVLGGLYASKFQDVWYRCVVEKIVGSQVHIRYIDFGNSEEKSASNLRPLNRQRLALPVRIFKCKLYGVCPVFPDWVHPDMPVYLSMLSEKKLQLEIRGEEEDGTLLVSLLVSDGQDVLDIGQDLVKIGWATHAKAAAAASPHIQETNADCDEENGDEEDEMELAKQIKQLQKMLEETKLKKKAKVTKK